MKTFQTETTIAASPEKVWAILTDASAYPSWNTTVQRVEGTIAPLETIKVFATISPGRAFPVKVSQFYVPKIMTWSSGMPLGLFKGVRTFTLDAAGATTTFGMKEVFSGVLSPLIGRSIPDLQPEFEKFAACLKEKAEASV
jgi:hypothetical protein